MNRISDNIKRSRVKDELAQRIVNGEFAFGSRFPGLNDLCGELGVSYVTVSKAVKMLADEGYLRCQPGVGYFVCYVKPDSEASKEVNIISTPGYYREHKDDFEFGIGEFAVKRFGSQGQQKTFLLALKLAQFEYIRTHLGTKPILLLDDVFDKLDMDRVSQLVLLVGSDRFGQVFITDTQPGRVEDIFRKAPDMPHRIFTVANGTVELVYHREM